ncbi:DNA/RNA-binding protein Kin17 conserved domain, partial [Trinorchestia longiramus]
MGKTEKGTPKDLANRMKAKGLQKLRWYCQMCQKQCRDENGFKCHTMSESHQRQLLLFAENPDKYLDSFSEDFYKDYLNLLKRRFGTKRVQANNVYQEYIHDRNHIHMNATQWETLTEFVKWLGREGHCIVDETEKGWFVAYIDRDPETILRQEKLAKKEKNEMDAEERHRLFIEKQIELGLKSAKNIPEPVFTDLKREGDNPIKLNLSLSSSSKAPITPATSLLKGKTSSKPAENLRNKDIPKKRSALEEIMEEEKRKKKVKATEESCASTQVTADEPWLSKDIAVKIVTKTLGHEYYKQKGVVYEVVDDYSAKVKLFDSKKKLKLDQAHLETVVPATGRQVVLLAGRYRGCKAELLSLQQEKFSATVRISDRDKVIEGILYEHFSKHVAAE